jgi:Xaa-Pro aminopeptidase
MKEKNIDAYVVCTDDFHASEYVGEYFKAREYMSGFTGSAGTLVVTKEKAMLWTDGRYFLQAEKELDNRIIELMKMGEEGVPSISEYLKEYLQNGNTIGFDGRTVSNNFVEEIYEKLGDTKINIKCDEDLVGVIWNDRPDLAKEKAWLLEEKYTGLNRICKLKNVRNYMEDNNIDTFILTTLDDIAWLLNLRGNDVKYNPVFLSYMIINIDDATLYVNEEILDDNIKELLLKDGILISSYNDVYKKIATIEKGKKVLLDYNRVNYMICKSIPSGVEIVNKTNPTVNMKAVKNAVEVSNIKKAHIKDGVAVTKFMYWLKNNIGKINMTEISVADKLEELRREQEGYIAPSFEPIMAYGVHGAVIHYSATEKTNSTIKSKGFLLSDTGGHYYEGTTDITRTFVMGELSDEERKAYTLVLRGHLNLAAAKFIYGTRGANLDILARQPLWECCMDYKHGTGHGVGYLLNVHEGPNSFRWRIGDKKTDSAILEDGMITSNEPGIYVEDRFGIRLENLILCKKSEKNIYGQFMEFENLTLVPFEKEAIDVKYMSDVEIELLNKYHQKVYITISQYLSKEEKEWLKDITSPLTKHCDTD